MTISPIALCNSCQLLTPGTTTCAAFPGGIPRSIYFDLADHRTSRAGEPTYVPDPARASSFEVWDAARKEP